MNKESYRPAGFALIAVMLAVVFLAGSAAAAAIHARALLDNTLSGRRMRTLETTHLSEFVLRAQMNRQQASSRVNGFMTVVQQQEVSLRIDGEKRYARRFEPIGKETQAPWALLLHGGLGSDGTQLLDVACELRLSGFRVLLPDLRAHGRSEGEISSLGLEERRDVSAWIDWIFMQEASPRIVVFGQDEGAAAALLSAGDLLNRVRAIAVDSAYSSIPARAMQLFEKLNGTESRADAWLFKAAYHMEFVFGRETQDVLEAVRSCSIPLLLIHGTGDEDVPAWHSEDIADAAGEEAEVFFVEGALHGEARFAEPKAYYDKLLSFFLDAVNHDHPLSR